MLIEFSVANFRSFRECQTFSLVKARGNELLEDNAFQTKGVNKFHLLRSAAIYGPNAGGKTNFLYALDIMQMIVLESATDMHRGTILPVVPFRLSDSTRRAPSEFELTFIVNEVRYQYGFAATRDRIHEEWLFAFPKGRPQRWFERTWNKRSQDYDWELGNKLTGEKELWRKSTRDNALFLSTAVQLNNEQLQPIYDWFKETLRMTDISGWSLDISTSLCEKSEEAKKEIVDFLRKADLGISYISVEKKPLGSTISTMSKKGYRHNVKTFHEDDEGNQVPLPLEEESDGTRRLFALAGPWIDSLNRGSILFIDELHDNLHPHMVKFLVELFHSSETNPNNAQLVFTTHDTSILNQDMFRRDQIWFCEKGEDQASTLYPLTDFRPRKGRENLEQAYLSGRYGALPYVRP